MPTSIGKLEDEKISDDFTKLDKTFPFELTRGAVEKMVDEEDFFEIKVAGETMKAEVKIP